jgi:hypothetical protein
MRRTICALAFLCASPAMAQQTPASTGAAAATPAPPAAAAALIAAASAQDLFEALPSDTQIVVRHTRSGLTCRMRSSWRNRIIIFPDAARGEDIACESTNGSATIRLYATRYSFRTTLDQQISGAVAAIRQTAPDAHDYAPTVTQSFPGLPATRSAAFLLTRANDHAQMYSHISVAMVSGWVYVMRYSAPAADAAAAHQSEVAAHALWQSTLGEVASGHL